MANAGAKAKFDPCFCYGCEKRFATPDGVCKHLGHAANASCRPKMDEAHRPFTERADRIHGFRQ